MEAGLCHARRMAQTLGPVVAAEDRLRLASIIGDRNRPQKHVTRGRIVLLSADRLDVAWIARRAGTSRPSVWRWQRRYAEAGVDGLLRDKTRKPGKPPLGDAVASRVVALTRGEPPGEAAHWTGRMMAKATGISLRSVQRIWAAHKLQPHRLRTFKRSRDPERITKLEAIVGLHMAPPRHAVVLSVDEKSRIQALDRTRPGLPLKPGKAGTLTQDCVRHGTTTLLAALNVLDGTVIGRCMARRRHPELLRFLDAVEAAAPAGKLVHGILDNYAGHKHPKVLAWLARHPRWTFHLTPTSSSPPVSPDTGRGADGSIASCDRWLKAVETFFAALTRRLIRRGTFTSIVDLQAAINRHLDEHNADPKPFTWTATPPTILAKLNQVNASVR